MLSTKYCQQNAVDSHYCKAITGIVIVNLKTLPLYGSMLDNGTALSLQSKGRRYDYEKVGHRVVHGNASMVLFPCRSCIFFLVPAPFPRVLLPIPSHSD